MLAKDFVMGMLKRNPKERSSLKELRNHQWLLLKPISKLESVASSNQPQQPIQEESSDQQNYKRIVAELNRKNQELQRELDALRINQQVLQQQLKDGNKDTAGSDDRRNKIIEEMGERHRKEISRFQLDLDERNKEIAKLKADTRQMDDLKKNAERYKAERNKLQ
ncbi:MAG: hypothetical protein JST59_02180 [Actinobacteria bacterium]|nr:hypothetical protein [Actinomycetota bacterium]